jgi:hypothetical protein
MKKLLLTIISTVLLGFISFTQPSNDYIGNALLMNACNQVFSASNAGATNNYSSSQGPCGTNGRNFDCNTSTGNNGSGHEVSYTIENDIWYYFCPGTNGTWTITIDQVSCSTNNGYQVWVGQGTPTNLHTEFYENGCGNGGCSKGVTGALTFNINVVDYTQGCVYIGIDGYAGTTCTFQITLSNPLACTLLANSLFVEGKRAYGCNNISWYGLDESATKEYLIYRSLDNKNWDVINRLENQNKQRYNYTDCITGVYYYKIVSIDEWDNIEDSKSVVISSKNIKTKSTKIFDVYGKEYSENNLPSGMVIYIIEYEDGSFETKKEYNAKK